MTIINELKIKKKRNLKIKGGDITASTIVQKEQGSSYSDESGSISRYPIKI